MGWRRFFRRKKWDAERARELESYLEIEADENVARGMPPQSARIAARQKLGNIIRIREEIYHMNTIGFLDTLARDVRYGLRTLRHNRTFAIVALLTLAVGIGANTAVFTVVNSVVLKPLPFPKSEDLVAVWQTAAGAPGLTGVSGGLRLSASMHFTYSENNRTFENFGSWFAAGASVTGLAEPEQVRMLLVTEGVLEALGVQPLLGRWLSYADQKPGSNTVMLNYGYWQRRFGGDRSVIGRRITVDSRPREIVGVMPAGFQLVNAVPDLIVPFAFDRSQIRLPGFAFQGVARLKPGVTLSEANADIARMVPIWMNSWPAAPGVNPRVYEGWKIAPALRPLKEDVIGNISNALWIVMGMIGIVMLIACANVANLLLVRAEARRQELAVRVALGAGSGRIVRELLLESVLLGLIGGTVGLGFAFAGIRFLVSLGPANLPRLNEVSIDLRALAFTLVVSVISGFVFGIVPAFKYARPPISMALRSGGRTLGQNRDHHRARGVLVVTQIALALVLLVCAGLMIRTFQALRTVEPGFTNPKQLQTALISIPASLITDPARVIRMQNDIVEKVSAIPGVTSIAFTSVVPMDPIAPNWDAIRTENKTYEGEVVPMRLFRSVSPGFFQTMGSRLIAGREYTWTDLYDRRHVVIISENLARELFATADKAIGQRLRTGLPTAPWQEIIGVIQDVRENGVHAAAPATVYWPAFGDSPYIPGPPSITRVVTFTIRSQGAGTETFLNQLRQAVWSVNSSLPVASVRTMQDIYDDSLTQTSFTLVMLAMAGTMALVLGIIGIYGVISYVVSQRTREIGIRVALGAEQGEVKGMFVRHGLALAGIGVVIGLIASAAVTRFMRSILFDVSPLDPAAYAAASVVLVIAALLASYLPARRAAAIDPAAALRLE